MKSLSVVVDILTFTLWILNKNCQGRRSEGVVYDTWNNDQCVIQRVLGLYGAREDKGFGNENDQDTNL